MEDLYAEPFDQRESSYNTDNVTSLLVTAGLD